MSVKNNAAKKIETTKAAAPKAPIESKSPVSDADAGVTAGIGEGWGAVEEAVKKAKEGGIFLKLEDDGESFTGVMLGQPFVRKVTFENSEFAKKGKAKPTTRIAMNVAVIDEKSKEITGVKVFEQGPVFFKKMLTVKEKFPLDKWAITVTRNGKAKDPKTDYLPLPDHQLTAAELATVAELELHDLEALANPDDSFDTEKLENEEAAE